MRLIAIAGAADHSQYGPIGGGERTDDANRALCVCVRARARAVCVPPGPQASARRPQAASVAEPTPAHAPTERPQAGLGALTGGKADAAQTAHDPSRPKAEVPGGRTGRGPVRGRATWMSRLFR